MGHGHHDRLQEFAVAFHQRGRGANHTGIGTMDWLGREQSMTSSG